MDASSSTNSNRIEAFRRSNTLHPQVGCRKLFECLNGLRASRGSSRPRRAEEGIRTDICSINSTDSSRCLVSTTRGGATFRTCNCSCKCWVEFTRLFRRNAKPALYCGRQVISTRTGISFLTGRVSSVGGSILKSVSVAGIVPDILISFPCVAS